MQNNSKIAVCNLEKYYKYNRLHKKLYLEFCICRTLNHFYKEQIKENVYILNQ